MEAGDIPPPPPRPRESPREPVTDGTDTTVEPVTPPDGGGEPKDVPITGPPPDTVEPSDTPATVGAGIAAAVDGYTNIDWAQVERYAPISAADAALVGQGGERYPGQDDWGTRVVEAGERIYFSSTGSGEHITGYGVLEGDLQDIGDNAQAYNERCQIRPHMETHTYRPVLECYKVKQAVEVADSTATENPRYGSGGMREVFVENVHELIQGGVLRKVGEITMTDTTSRLGVF